MKIKMENLNEFYIKKLEQQVEQLQADKAQLREALLEAESDLLFGKKISIPNYITKALASTDSSNWLQEQKAQWRREVLEEAAQQLVAIPDMTYAQGHMAAEILRRMAEQPESK